MDNKTGSVFLAALGLLFVILGGCSSTSPELSVAAGRQFYVSAEYGNDTNDGLSLQTPFASLQRAAGPLAAGDTLNILNGTYTQAGLNANVLYFDKSGRPGAWITIRAYPGHKPKLKVLENNNQGIGIAGSSYLIIEGLEVEGYAKEIKFEAAYADYLKGLAAKEAGDPNFEKVFDQRYAACGICMDIFQADSNAPRVNPHHVIIRKNILHDNSGHGIGVGQTDYVVIEDNIVYDNARFSPGGNSGISVYQTFNFDDHSKPDYNIIIRRNRIYNNESLIPFFMTGASKTVTDGNGIILDDLNNEQNDPNNTRPPYTGRTLVANNLIYNNGGRGILAGGVDNADILNNTTYYNMRDETIRRPEFSYSNKEGEISTSNAGNNNIFNNIMVVRPGKPVNEQVADRGNNVYSNNLIFGSDKFTVTPNSVNNSLGVDPLFVSAATFDFRLTAASPAIDKGSSILRVTTDFTKSVRPQGNGADIGAYEYPVTTLSNGVYKITARHSGKALDVRDRNLEDGAVVQQWSYGGPTNQRWRTERQADGTYRFTALHSGKVLGVTGTTDGSAVQQVTWNGSCGQKWHAENRTDGAKTLRSSCGDKVLDVVNASRADGAVLEVWNFSGRSHQAFVLERLGD
jgi:hypothetical protein